MAVAAAESELSLQRAVVLRFKEAALYLRTGDPRRVGGHGQEHLPLRRVHHDKRGRAYTHRLAHILIGEDVLVAVGDNGNTPL